MHLCVAARNIEAHAASGLVHATSALVQTLAAEGHTVRLLTDRSRLATPALAGVSIERLTVPLAAGPFRGAGPETAEHNLLHAAAVYREVRRIHEHEQPVDAVLAPLWRSEGALCLLDDRFPTVVTCMTSLRRLTEIDDSYCRLPDIEKRLSLERETLLRCRYLHGLTKADLSRTIEDYRLTPTLTAVIGRGLRDRAPSAPSANGADGTLELLFVGRIERRKGVDTLLQAVGDLVDDGLPLRLRLVGPDGDPELRLRLRREASRGPRLARAVQFVGAVSETELEQFYAESDIVCVPSRYESHGVVPIEAMMFGKPLVSSSAGGIGEVVEAERNALVCPPGDAQALARALRRLAAQPELRAKLGAAARATFERRFDARLMAGEMQSFLEEVTTCHRATPPGADGVPARLQALLQEVLQIAPDDARQAAAEMLDPEASEPLRRLGAAARSAPPPPQRDAGPRMTAIVLTHDRAELLERALDSLEVSGSPLATIVIDNGSTPAHARRIAAICAAREQVKLRRSELNLGCAGGRRLASELADRELVLFLDDDAELLPGAVGHMLADLDAHPSAVAVTATVVLSDGRIHHSGGWFERDDGVITFGRIGGDVEFGSEELPPSGSAAWVPGTAVLVRRDALDEFPLDQEMAAYCEDNEWCYRVSSERTGSFRRCREALAFHRFATSYPQAGHGHNAHRVELLAAATRFYQRHGAVIDPWTVDAALPELRAPDGTCDLAAAKLLMELLAAKGREWMLAAFDSGELEGFLNAGRRRTELTDAHAELERLRQAVAAQEETLGVMHERLADLEERSAFLYERHLTLCRVEEGGWWRLRGRILPLIRGASLARRRLMRLRGTDQSPLA